MTAPEDDKPSDATTLPQPPAHKGSISKSGIVLGPDGKPCRSCNSYRDMASMARLFSNQPAKKIPKDCPPDVEQLGRSTWTFLHSLTASYPESPSTAEKKEMAAFMTIFSRIYPCWVCADDFREWMTTEGNGVEKAVEGREDFGRWMCRAHNAVNVKLGKKEFDCARWRERWRDGWGNGRCG